MKKTLLGICAIGAFTFSFASGDIKPLQEYHGVVESGISSDMTTGKDTFPVSVKLDNGCTALLEAQHTDKRIFARVTNVKCNDELAKPEGWLYDEKHVYGAESLMPGTNVYVLLKAAETKI